MPFTHARRALSLGGRWTAVDGTVIVGTKPSALLGDPRRLAAMGVTSAPIKFLSGLSYESSGLLGG